MSKLIRNIFNSTIFSEQINNLRKEILSIPPYSSLFLLDDLKGFMSIGDDDWGKIKYTFSKNFRNYDRILYQIHQKRNAKLSKEEKQTIMKFLTIGYVISGDVRYFNEYLWIDNKYNNVFFHLNLANFKQNLIDGIHHKHPLFTKNEVHKWTEYIKSEVNKVNVKKKAMKIALLGYPYSLKILVDELKLLGYNFTTFYFPAHINNIKSWILNNNILSTIYFKLKGCNFKIEKIDYLPMDNRVADVLGKGNYDLAVHKLGFIIRNNIIKCFRIGILNDHLGVLPFIRGRSTLEFSLLFGFDLGATMHIIDDGVDTGKIIAIYTYDMIKRGFRNTQDIKNLIVKDSKFRYVESIKYISDKDYILFNNDKQKGMQYYYIHPEIVKYIDSYVIKRL